MDDLRKENTMLKCTVDCIHSKVEVVQRENKQLNNFNAEQSNVLRDTGE
jgi:hypothetical protein